MKKIALQDAVAMIPEGATLLPLTSLRQVDLVVTELAVIAFSDNRATLVETAPNVTAQDVIASTEAELVVPEHVPQMNL